MSVISSFQFWHFSEEIVSEYPKDISATASKAGKNKGS